MKRLIKVILVGVIVITLTGCAFAPREVVVEKVESSISYPRVDFRGRHKISFGPVVDSRSSEVDFGIMRNKLMMKTGTASLSGKVTPLLKRMIKGNFLVSGIEEGDSDYTVSANLIETHTDLPGPDHVYVRVRVALSIVKSETNTVIYYEQLEGYSVEGVIQIGNEAHERGFIGAMNQISDQVQNIAVATESYLSGKKSSIEPQEYKRPEQPFVNSVPAMMEMMPAMGARRPIHCTGSLSGYGRGGYSVGTGVTCY